ncbi:hypothetical protein [Methanoplanus limicola]|uniref:Uncharacterized protein n=1 Tax=Methanoplanus limicola DSM 2279 TaxID=937775 RepID=H1Z096_9EURY|nr:hypothetical protein [Methanoplanus limicola]EHQ36188.1 hypothetical protein Metlim_2106 [Methanoplanus limicola DSM 2279]
MKFGEVNSYIQDIIRNNNYLIIIDTQSSQPFGSLRSVPLLHEISGCMDLSIFDPEAAISRNFPLKLIQDISFQDLSNCSDKGSLLSLIILNSGYEEKTGYVSSIIESNTPKIFVGDSIGFTPKNWRYSGKSIEEKSIQIPLNYNRVYSKFIEDNCLQEFQFKTTKNVFFNNLYRLEYRLLGKKSAQVSDLFNFGEEILAITPIWDILVELLGNIKSSNDKFNDISISLKPWIEDENDVKSVSEKLYNILNENDFDPSLIIETRDGYISNNHENFLQICESCKDNDIQGYISEIIGE